MINQLIQQAQPYWKQYVEHEFVQQLAQGVLPKACFQHYLKQDYIYLFHYSRAFALGVFKARNFAEMDMPRKTLDILCQEIQLHLDYCRQWDISEQEIFQTPESAACISYTRYLQRPAQQAEQPPVLHQHRVHPQAAGLNGCLQRLGQLPVRHQGVQRQKDPDPPLVAVGQGGGELLIRKIFRAPAGVEGAPAQVHRVRAVLDRRPQSLRRTGGGQQLRPHPRSFRAWASSFCWRRKTSRLSSLTSAWALPASSRYPLI